METNNKKNVKLFIIGIVVLLIMIISATYAYFAVTTVNNFGTSIINAQAGSIGSVTLNGNNVILTMSLEALDMVQGSNNVTYYASSSGKTETYTEAILGTASVTPSTDETFYHCTYTLNVTHTGTRDMYTIFNSKTNNVYDYTNRSAGQIILTINGVDYDFTGSWPSQVTQDFYITGGESVDVVASFKIINSKTIDQSYLAGSDISISIGLVNNSFSCIAEEGIDQYFGIDPIVQ